MRAAAEFFHLILSLLFASCSCSRLQMGDGYFMVFRLQPGTRTSAFEAFIKGTNTINTYGDKTVNDLAGTDEGWGAHYRSDFLDTWTGLDEVRITIYADCEVKAVYNFFGAGSTLYNWIDYNRLHAEYPYKDIVQFPFENFNNFSVEGDVSNNRKRRFFMNHVYGDTCQGDKGWLAVIDGPRGPCKYERTRCSCWPCILYSKKETVGTYSDESSVGVADSMVISVKLK